jgi:glutamyl-tRNA reductase
MSILLLGTSHRTAPLALREALSFSSDDALTLQRRARPALDELVVLSTCHRTELYASSPADADATEAALRRLVLEAKGADLLAPAAHVYRLEDGAAAHHLLRVAAGLESLVIGEPQILGQVRLALAAARSAGSVGATLGALFDAALRAGKRARAETDIGKGRASVAAAAVEQAARAGARLAGGSLVVVGAGDTARLVVAELVKRGPRRLVVVNRDAARAAELAGVVGAGALPLEQLPRALAEADAAFFATRAPQPLLTADRLSPLREPARPLWIVDLGMPRNVQPAVAALSGVQVIAVDGLGEAAAARLEARRAAVPRVESIVEEELTAFLSSWRARGLAPLVRELREHFERVRLLELSRLHALAPDERERVERLTRALVNKLLHQPTTRLKELGGGDAAVELRARTLRELFGLEAGPGEARHG